MPRTFYHYSKLEEVAAGMWRISRGDDRKSCIARAAALMKDSARFEDAMCKAIREWPRSCEAAFTADAVNQIAWLGHAGCCIAEHSPEECTRCAWHLLTQDEQDAANAAAARALRTWSFSSTAQPDLFASC